MSSTLLRLGLWMLVLVLALFVLQTTYGDSPLAEMIPNAMLQQALVLAVLVVIAGLVVKMFEKGKKVVSKNRCRVCSKPIPAGAIYCREHLRNVLELEDRRTHNTRIR
ncbi:MAG TPA: hypothetical protein VFT12_10745 [Thermoanaerobaculia bacterium]|nr:hypothetical protein [Thermoanaerobaculia bacterium]